MRIPRLAGLARAALTGAVLASSQQASGETHDQPTALFSATVPILLGLGILLLGMLQVRAVARKKRALRRAALVYVLYLAGLASRVALELAGLELWARRVELASQVLALLALANLTAAVLFDVLGPALRIHLASIVGDLAVGFAYAAVGLWAAHRLGVNVTGLLATSAIVTAIVGLSLQGTLANAVGGLALQLDESFAVGDWIELPGEVQGQVREIRWRHTVVETRDWDTLVVPNASLLSQTIKVLGKREGEPLQHRMWVYFNVDFRHAPDDVIRVVEEALQAAPILNVAERPAPNCVCMDLAGHGRDSFAHYAVRYWLTNLAPNDPTNSMVRERIYAALRRAGIPLAVPGAAIFVSEDDPEHAGRKLDREQKERAFQLGALELFGSMTPEEKVRLSGRMRAAPFAPGEVITRQGAVADWLYVLSKGKVGVCVADSAGAQAEIAVIQAPDIFGEMGLMTGQPRQATIVARSSVECYRIDKQDFEDILRQRPAIAAAISEVLAARDASLAAAQGQLDSEGRRSRVESEARRILASMQQFFGLSEGAPPHA